MKKHLLFFLLTGCAGAELVKTQVHPPGGTVRYNNGKLVRDESREMAIKKLQAYCGDKTPHVMGEEFNPYVASVVLDGQYYSEKDNYMFIEFTCGE